MSSATSNSTEPAAPPRPPNGGEPGQESAKQASGGPVGPVVTAAVTLGLLGALVWMLNPRRPAFTPAPLEGGTHECLKISRPFVPTNLTELPEPGLARLGAAARNSAVFRMNMQPCTCGCNLSIAVCRVTNPSCKVSPELAKKVIAEAAKGKPSRP